MLPPESDFADVSLSLLAANCFVLKFVYCAIIGSIHKVQRSGLNFKPSTSLTNSLQHYHAPPSSAPSARGSGHTGTSNSNSATPTTSALEAVAQPQVRLLPAQTLKMPPVPATTMPLQTQPPTQSRIRVVARAVVAAPGPNCLGAGGLIILDAARRGLVPRGMHHLVSSTPNVR